MVACPKGCDQSVETAKKPWHVLPKIKATHALLAHIIVSKFIDRQPLYHLEKQFDQRFGMSISRRCMADWLIDLTPQYQLLLNLLKDEIINYPVASLDATTLQVLREPNRSATKKSYAYCFREWRLRIISCYTTNCRPVNRITSSIGHCCKKIKLTKNIYFYCRFCKSWAVLTY